MQPIKEPGKGNPCPKCLRPMERRKHKVITEKLMKKFYYFSQWDVCRSCKHIQHYPEFKVMSNGSVY